MDDFLQLVVSGLGTGGIYALAAVGFTLLWQTSQTINFAQGEFVMLPVFFALAAAKVLGLPWFAAAALAILLSMLLLGLIFKVIVVDPLIKQGTLPLVISTIGLAILLRESVKVFYAAEAQRVPSFFPAINLGGGNFTISADQIGVLAVATAAILLLNWFLSGTKTGRKMQATAQNPAVARILGVNVKRMVLYTFLINGALAAVASLLISPIYLAKFSGGETLGLTAFVAAIVGGFNQVRGAILGGFLVGVVDNLVAAYVSSTYRQAVPLALLVLIILVRPQGLLGRKEERTV
jgi:branched-chain amino acid transport system permease protein